MISGQSTQGTIPDMELGTTQHASSVSILYTRIYSKVEDYKTNIKMRVDTDYAWKKMAAASISTSSHYQIPQ